MALLALQYFSFSCAPDYQCQVFLCVVGGRFSSRSSLQLGANSRCSGRFRCFGVRAGSAEQGLQVLTFAVLESPRDKFVPVNVMALTRRMDLCSACSRVWWQRGFPKESLVHVGLRIPPGWLQPLRGCQSPVHPR